MPDIPPKIADGLPNAKGVLGDRLVSASTEDGKLWFVSRKIVSQRSISFWHETPLLGGNVVFFDVRTKTWSDPTPFPSMSDEELLKGEIFGYKNRLLLLTYRASGQFAFRDLYEWKDQKWLKIDLEADEKTKFESDTYAKMKLVVDASGNVYLIAEHGFCGLKIYKLQFSDDGKKATVAFQRDVPAAFGGRHSRGAHLVRVTVSADHLYGLYGEQGCGFRWEPTRPFRIDLRDGSVERLQTGPRPRPPWSFHGALADYLVPPYQWFFFGGTRARGIRWRTKHDPSIWILDLEKKEWNRFKAFDIPEGARFAGAVGDEGSPAKFYVVNVDTGVYEVDSSKV